MKNSLDNFFGNPVQRIDEIIKEAMADITAEVGGDEVVQDLVRKEKACKIDDIFRGAKLAQCHDYRFVVELRDPVCFFDKLYELDLYALDAYSKALDKKNTEYMKRQVLSHNRGDDLWMLY